MAMMSANQSNPIFNATYERLLAAGKPKKSRDSCMYAKDGSYTEFNAQRWGYVG